ncbi:recombinase family protein [Agromyces allii]|uniref:Recombinase family protein n=1 Tax=Agromyces allii TaxID=393607 RepID=A0ABP5BEC3_9MICO|nr:recombinase family protein [Agromyces allii]
MSASKAPARFKGTGRIGPRRCVIYSRISADKEGDAQGVARQEDDCRALAKRHEFEVVQVYRDNDISASTKSTKPRPAYDAMLDAARAGAFEAILSYSNSRLTRRPREFEDLIDLHERTGIQFHTVASGSFDLSTADGRRMARFLAGEATAEAERTSERVRRAKAENVLKGEYRGGPRPFGYENGGMKVRPKEAEAIAYAASAVLEGRSLAAVARELNERGIRPASTNRKDRDLKKTPPRWKAGNLRDMLLRPRNAGILAHGLPNRNATTNNSTKKYKEIGPAAWPAVLDEDVWRALKAVLTEQSRRTNVNSDVRWLGTGIYRCGVPLTRENTDAPEGEVCGGKLRTAPHGGTGSRKGPRRMLYRCSERAHLTVAQESTDAYVLGQVAELVRDPRIVAGLSPTTAVDVQPERDARAVLLARLKRTDHDYDEDLIDARRHREKTTKLNAELAAIDKKLADAAHRSASNPILGAPDPGQAFLDAPVDIQRAVLASVVRVTVTPQTVGRGRAWSSDRIRLEPVGGGAVTDR